MKVNQSLLRIVPEAFKPIDIDLSQRKSLLMVHSEMSVATEHQGVIAMKPIGVNLLTFTIAYIIAKICGSLKKNF